MSRRRTARRCRSVLVSAALATACGGSEEPAAPDAILAAERLVVGDWLDETGLLVLPTGGGRPELRAGTDPTTVAWRARSRLPRLIAAVAIGDHSVLLRSPDASAHRFDPVEDVAAPEPDVKAVDGWSQSGGQVAVWSGRAVLAFGEGDRRAFDAPAPVQWAAAMPDGGLVALLDTETGTVLAAFDESAELRGQLGMDVRPPGLTPGWGRSVLLLSADGRQLVSVRLPELDVERRFDLRRPATAAALSASSHEVYVAQPGRIEAIDRVTGATRRLAEIDGEIGELRPEMYGQQLLAHGGEGVYAISLAGDRPVRVDVDWRNDLPIGLPDGRILATRGDSLYLIRPRGRSDEGGVRTPVDGPVDAIWLPIRWNALGRAELPTATADRRDTPTAAPDEVPADSAAAAALQPGLDVEAPEGLEELVPPVDSVGLAFGAPAAGYYAVAMASPEADGVVELVSALARSGYPTAIQRRRDDGGTLWYRALLGPYPVRERAEAAARQLRRERGLDAWVTEVTAGAEGEF